MSDKPDNVARGPWGTRAVDDTTRQSQPAETVVRTPHGTVTFRDATDADIEASFVDDTVGNASEESQSRPLQGRAHDPYGRGGSTSGDPDGRG